MVRFTRPAISVFVAAAVAYALFVRRMLVRWGATDEEVNAEYPGADVVPHGVRAATMAVTIDAPVSAVWPWLVQMGYDRAGWYSWDRLDNGGRRSASDVHPKWQELAVGDSLRAWSPNGAVDTWRVARLDPEHFLGLHGLSDLRGTVLDSALPRPTAYTEGLWGFSLHELPDDRTRLVVSGYQTLRPRWFEPIFNYWIYPLLHWPMQVRQFANLKRNAERHYRTSAPAVPADRPLDGTVRSSPCVAGNASSS